jgi:hypothetical protein
MSFDFLGASPGRSSSTPSYRHWWPVVLACVFYTLTIQLYQRVQGAPMAAFGGYPDESSHYISGLLVRDYLMSGSAMSPLRYAANYYIHVPFFAVGYWPPLFYTAEGLWMILFGFSRPAVLVFIALIAAGSATLLFACLRGKFGNMPAFGAGLLFLFSPIVLWSSGLVMTDLLVTFFSFAATLAFARYLDSGRILPMLAFSVLAAATILTKSSGAFLAIVPPAAVLISSKLGLLRRFSFWLGLVVVVVLCAPWFLLTRSLIGRGFQKYQKPGLIDTIGQLGSGLLQNVVWIVPFIVIGIWCLSRGPRPMPSIAAVCLVQPIAVVLFLMVAPVGNEARYLTPALPPLIVLAMYGMHAIADLAAPTQKRLVMTAGIALGAGLLLAVAAHRLHQLPADSLRPMAEFVIARGYHSVLIPADAEGPAIAEISEREPDRLARFLVRSGKLLARTDWTGAEYRALYETKEGIQGLFDELPLDAVIIQMNPRDDAAEHERLLRDMVQAFPNRWRLVCSFISTSSPARYAVYEPVKLRYLSQQDLAYYLQNLLNPNLPRPR